MNDMTQMAFWLDSNGKLSNIPFIDDKVSFFESLKSMIYATCLIMMFIPSQPTIIFSDFLLNINLGRIARGSSFLWVNDSSIRRARRI